MIVVGHLLILFCANHLDIGEIGDKNSKEQREEGNEAREAMAKRYTAKHA